VGAVGHVVLPAERMDWFLRNGSSLLLAWLRAAARRRAPLLGKWLFLGWERVIIFNFLAGGRCAKSGAHAGLNKYRGPKFH
jgi:hypothetical protein